MKKLPVIKILSIVIPVALMGGLFAYAIPFLSTTWYEYAEPSTDLTKLEVSPITYHDLGQQAWINTENKKAMPAITEEGDTLNLLCIPVELDDYPFSEAVLADLRTVFNGTSEETGYWESLSSYYGKASFGKLNINVEMADIYRPNMTASKLASSRTPTSVSNPLVKSAVENYFATTTDHPDLDYDDNGYIDGIYLIYSCPNFTEAKKDADSYYYEDTQDQEYLDKLYWAYTAWNTSRSSAPLQPNAYVWASYDFMYRDAASPSVDGHTYIHETGHLLGLADYYNTVSEENAGFYGKYAHYQPAGSLQMMDHNIGDFDAWTKFSLGWSSAYIVDKNKPFPQTFELQESNLAGDLLLIPANQDDSYRDIQDYSAFGEYIVLELYNPTGLNYLDSQKTNLLHGYLGSYPTMYNITGVRASHIDSRLYNASEYRNPTIEDVRAASGFGCYTVIAHNVLTDSTVANANRVFWLNQILESSGQETLVTESSHATNETLFKGNDQKGNFSMSKFSSYFTIKDDSGNPLFNNGKEFGYTFRINGEKTKNGINCVSITVDKEGE